jgi:hypothetical protein
MKTISLSAFVGTFAEDKDMAARLRKEEILPALSVGEEIELDFGGITLATQSFIHALISEAIRIHGEEALELIVFKNCGVAPKGIIQTVVQYVLETLEDA